MPKYKPNWGVLMSTKVEHRDFYGNQLMLVTYRFLHFKINQVGWKIYMKTM